MARSQKSQCALDVNILLDLARGLAVTKEFYGVVRDLHHPLFMFSRKLIRKGYLDEEEYNDGLILAEVAMKEIDVLVTMDHHLLDIPFNVLQAELKDSGFFLQTAVFAPWQVTRVARRVGR